MMHGVRCSEHGIETLPLEPDATDLHAPEEDVRVRTRSASICQTDINLSNFGALPFTMGHEFAGVLDDGTPVGIEPLAPCGACAYCDRNDYHFCEKGHQMVIGIGRNGGMADEVVVPARSIVPLPTGLDVRDACLIEPLAEEIQRNDCVVYEIPNPIELSLKFGFGRKVPCHGAIPFESNWTRIDHSPMRGP